MSRWRPLEFDQNGAQSHLGPPPPNGHLGSCLSASLEMMLDYHRRTAATASSSFHGVVPRMARKARPNGDVVNMYWNQALLHHQIWGQKTRLLDFVLRSSRLMDGTSSARVRRNAGMFEAITYSLQPEHHGGRRGCLLSGPSCAERAEAHGHHLECRSIPPTDYPPSPRHAGTVVGVRR